MALINFSVITFIPSVEFTFGSFSFIAGIDGRLHVSNPEATSIGQIDPDPADHTFTRSISEPDSDRLRDRFILPRYPFGLHNSANTFQRMLSQIMEVQAEHSTNMGELGQTVGVNRLTYDECRAINVIIEPYELPDHGDESLHRILNSPTNFESSIGSWDPVRRLYTIIRQGGEGLAEPHLKAQEDEAQRWADEEHAACLQEQEIAAQAACLLMR